MNIDALKRNILIKIENKDLNFNNDEVALLQLDQKLLLRLMKLISENEDLFYNLFFTIETISENIEFDNNIIEEIPPFFEEKYYIYNFILKGECSVEWIQKNYNLFIQKMKNDNFKINIYDSNVYDCSNLINRLLDDKEYLVINKLFLQSFFVKIENNDVINRMISEFPFNQYFINLERIIMKNGSEFIKNIFNMDNEGLKRRESIIEHLDRIDILNLLFIYDKAIFFDSFQKKVLDSITRKANSENENLNFICKDSVLFAKLSCVFEKYNQPINDRNISIYLNFNIALDDNQIDEICTILKNITFSVSLNNAYLINNNKIINTLIETGNYTNLLIEVQEANVEYFSKCLMDAIERNDTRFLSNVKVSLNNSLYNDLIIKLINKNCFDLIDINYSSSSDSMVNNAIINKILELPFDKVKDSNFFKKYMQNIQDFYKKKLFEQLMINKQFDKLMLVDFSINISNKDYDLLENEIKNNICFASNFLFKCDTYIIYHEQFRRLYLSLGVDYFSEFLLNKLQHIDFNDKFYDEFMYNSVKHIFINKYNLNKEHFDLLAQKYGYLIIKYINSSNIISIINLDEEKFNRFIEIFPMISYELKDLETIYDSFKQSEFAKKYPDIKNIFPNIMRALEDKDDKFYDYLKKLKEVWLDNLIKKIISKYPEEELIIKSNLDYIEYVGTILNDTNSSKEKDKYIDIIHIITDYYISNKREEYRITYDMYVDAKVPFKYDSKDLERLELIKQIEEGIILNMNGLNGPDIYNKIANDMIEEEVSKQGIREAFLLIVRNSIISHLKNDDYGFQNFFRSSEKIEDVINQLKEQFEKIKSSPTVKKNIGLVFKLARKYELNISLCDSDQEKAKKKYYFDDSKLNIFEIFSNIRMELFEGNILSDEKMYESLKKIMKKYKLYLLPPQVDTIIERDIFDLSCRCSDVSTFISFFHSIYEETKGKIEKANITVLFEYMDKYSAVSSIYSQILTSEDEGLIRSDPKPNNSGMLKEARLQKAIDKCFRNFQRRSVKIPTFHYDAKLDDGKILSVIIGNFTKATNLTHGERTGACMRIGGVGYSLFDSDEIFHIEFDEPSTGEYISRVTGFRNGNTVFLNELRCSCNSKKYSDLDVVNACRQVANQLIELSRDSLYPIENVVVHRDYAMLATEDDRVELNIINNKIGLKHFYSDVGSYVQVLASTTKGGFTPVKLDNSNVPSYQPVREKIRRGNGKSIVEQINRIYTINLALQGNDYYVEPIASDIIYGIVGEDWYVFIDMENKIISDRMNRDDRSKAEFEYALEEIKNYFGSSLVEEETYAK